MTTARPRPSTISGSDTSGSTFRTRPPRAQADDRAMFRDYHPARLGRMKVKDVRPTDIDALHRAISSPRKIRANRVVEVLSKAFALAIRWEWRSDNPCHGRAS